MSTLTAVSNNPSSSVAANELKRGLVGGPHRLVLYFASSAYDPNELARDVQRAFGPVPTLGCTTAGEIISGKMLKSSVVAMALGPDLIDDACLAWVDLKNPKKAVSEAMGAFEKHFKAPVSKLPHDKYVGLVLTDGLSCAEEPLLETITDRTNIPFVGGSAGDDAKFKSTSLFMKGEARSGVAALALMPTRAPFEIVKTQSFKPLGKTLKVTRADEAKRTVHEFNGQPAAKAYASALGTTPDKVADQFMRHPLGLMVSATEPFVRSPQQLNGQSVVFYCAMKEGMELSILESTDIVQDTARVLEAVKSRGPISATVNFHCILRTLELEREKKTQAYADLFAAFPTIGFSTYGESYVGHINQTSTMLVFH